MRFLILVLFSCFIKDTPVIMANNNPFKAPAIAYTMAALPLISPIQDIKPDDVVKSYHHEQSYNAIADSNDKIYVLEWQSYDNLDITPETWQIGAFEIIEADGDIVNVEANRPLTWYKENNVNAIGDKAHFYMPEIGINGNATLLSLRPTTITTTNLPLNEIGQVDRPVITTFKRNASIIYDYHFSDGAVIGDTPEHPFFSVDRNSYIAVGELQLCERVMTAGEKVVKFIAGKQRDTGITISPIPTSDHIQISSDKYQVSMVELYNVQGQIVVQQVSDINTIDISMLRAGLYIIKIYSGQGVIVGKVVVER